MKKNELAKIKGQSAAELTKMIFERREKLTQLERDVAANKVKNVHAARALRRDIAQIMTLMQNSKPVVK